VDSVGDEVRMDLTRKAANEVGGLAQGGEERDVGKHKGDGRRGKDSDVQRDGDKSFGRNLRQSRSRRSRCASVEVATRDANRESLENASQHRYEVRREIGDGNLERQGRRRRDRRREREREKELDPEAHSWQEWEEHRWEVSGSRPSFLDALKEANLELGWLGALEAQEYRCAHEDVNTEDAKPLPTWYLACTRQLGRSLDGIAH
jgi:hypothetical protein